MPKLLTKIARALFATAPETSRRPRKDDSWRDLTIGMVIR